MKKIFKVLAIIALVAVIGFSFAACEGEDDSGGGGKSTGDTGTEDSTGDTDTEGGGNKDLSGTVIISPSTGVITGTELTVTYSGSETVSYQWKNGVTNVGTNSNKFTPTTAGSYTVTVSAEGYNNKDSNAVTVAGWIEVENIQGYFTKIAYGNGTFVAGSYGGRRAYSSDGVTWTVVEDDIITKNIDSIAYGNGIFLALADNIYLSDDGVTWTAVPGSFTYAYRIVSLNNIFYEFYSNMGIYMSLDGKSWTKFFYDNNKIIQAIAYGNGTFVVGGYNGSMSYSSDGKTWTEVGNSKFGSTSIEAIAYGNNKFVAVNNSKMAHSPDGVTWTSVTTEIDYSNEIIYGNGMFFANSYYSYDGLTWTRSSDRPVSQIAYGDGKFVAIMDSKIVYLLVN